MEINEGGRESELDGIDNTTISDDDRNGHLAEACDAGDAVLISQK